MPIVQRLREATDRYLGSADGVRLFRAPGRVNLIGEHTDYNDGFVLPCALDMDFGVAIRPVPGHEARTWAVDMDEGATPSPGAESHVDSLDVRDPHSGSSPEWARYARAVVWSLAEEGVSVGGFDAVFASDVPLGAGLSSSAAFEVALATALCGVFDITIPPRELALLCQRAENRFVGVQCGIMDQTIAVLGRASHGLFLDCRDLSFEHVPLDTSAYRIVVCDTAKPRTLAASKYNERRSECEAATEAIAALHAEVRALRDADLAMLGEVEDRVSDEVMRRARHVISENDRVLRAKELLADGDASGFGELMAQSHISLRDDYEVSCAELDAMVEVADDLDACLGARMTGAGFGGCTVNLVAVDGVDAFCEHVRRAYPERTDLTPRVFVCEAADGAGECGG